MVKKGPFALFFHTLIVIFMLAPMVVVCLVAFTPENTLSMPWNGLSLRWFQAVFAHNDFMTAFGNSLKLALFSATLSTALAVPSGLAIAQYAFRGCDALNALFLSPLIIPHLVLGIAFLRLFTLMGFTGTFGWLVAAHTIVVTPYALRLILASLGSMDRNAENAARTLGAG